LRRAATAECHIFLICCYAAPAEFSRAADYADSGIIFRAATVLRRCCRVGAALNIIDLSICLSPPRHYAIFCHYDAAAIYASPLFRHFTFAMPPHAAELRYDDCYAYMLLILLRRAASLRHAAPPLISCIQAHQKNSHVFAILITFDY